MTNSTVIHELAPPIPVITIEGEGLAFAMIDYGFNEQTVFATVLDSTGMINMTIATEIKFKRNWTIGRLKTSDYI